MIRLQRSALIRGRYAWERARRWWLRAQNHQVLQGDPARPVVVQIDTPQVGLFAQLTWCIKLAAWAEATGRWFHFSSTSRNYSPDGADWLSAVFTQRSSDVLPPVVARTSLPRVRLERDFTDFPFFDHPDVRLTIPKARSLFTRTFSFAPDVLAAAAAAQALWPAEQPVIGVHFRGTDKHKEAQPVTPARVLRVLEATSHLCAARWGMPPVFFVATDEAAFVPLLRQHFGAERIFSRDEVERSASSRAVHASHATSLQRACDAVVDAVLLSRCRLLVRTASYLSGWAAVFARDQPVVMLNQPYAAVTWFPDREVLKEALPVNRLHEAITAVPWPVA